MNAAVFAYSRAGCALARHIADALSGAEVLLYTMARFEEPDFLPIEKCVYALEFSRRDALIFVGACGIAVRELAPFIRDKKTDPAVLVVDERARHVIPILSGHIGGANRLAMQLAGALGAEAVITTATDVSGRFAVDEFAAQTGCAISDMQLAKAFAAEILEHDLPLCSAFPIAPPLPGGVYEGGSGDLGVYIGCDVQEPFKITLRLIPGKLRVGVGCRRGASAPAITSAIRRVFEENRLDLRAISGVFSIDLKKDEPGLLQACRENGWEASFYSAEALQAVPEEFTASSFVSSVTGVDNVCERAAMLGARQLLVSKTVCDSVTIAVALEHWEVHFG